MQPRRYTLLSPPLPRQLTYSADAHHPNLRPPQNAVTATPTVPVKRVLSSLPPPPPAPHPPPPTTPAKEALRNNPHPALPPRQTPQEATAASRETDAAHPRPGPIHTHHLRLLRHELPHLGPPGHIDPPVLPREVPLRHRFPGDVGHKHKYRHAVLLRGAEEGA